MTSLIRVGELEIDPNKFRWIREEYRERWTELITRKQAADLAGRSPGALSSLLARYIDLSPLIVGKYGTNVFFVRSEAEDFVKKIEKLCEEAPGKNKGRRSQRSALETAVSKLTHAERKDASLEVRIAKTSEALAQLKQDWRVVQGEIRGLQEQVAMLKRSVADNA